MVFGARPHVDEVGIVGGAAAGSERRRQVVDLGYREGDDSSEIGSCDLYDVVADKIVLITSDSAEV